MRGKRALSICTTLLIMLIAIAGCGKKEDMTGKWVYTDTTGQTEIMELFSDGTGTLTSGGISQSCEWTIQDDRLKIDVDTGIFGTVSLVVDYELDDETLTLTNEGETITYIRGK